MNVHKELFKLFYQAERLSSAILFERYCAYKCPLDSSQDAIRMAYRYQFDGIDICNLFEAQAAACSVMVARRKPDFSQSEKLTAALEKFRGVAA